MGKPIKKAPPHEVTEPNVNSNFNTISVKPGKLSRDYFYIGERAVAYFEGRVCWSRPDISTLELQRVYFEAQRRECSMIRKHMDIDDFEYAESGTVKPEKAIGEKAHIEILADMGVVAFRYCKELVPLLARLAWKIHILEKHSSDKQSEAYLMEGCDKVYCADVRGIVARMNKDLFFGTLDMEDLTSAIRVERKEAIK